MRFCFHLCCLLVCLKAGKLKNYWTVLHRMWWRKWGMGLKPWCDLKRVDAEMSLFLLNFAGGHSTCSSTLHDYGKQLCLPNAWYIFKMRVFKVTNMPMLCYYICVGMYLWSTDTSPHDTTHTPLEAARLRAAILGNATGLESGLALCPLKCDKAQLGSPQDLRPMSFMVPRQERKKLKHHIPTQVWWNNLYSSFWLITLLCVTEALLQSTKIGLSGWWKSFFI